MLIENLLFFVFSSLSILFSFSVIVSKNPVHSILSLILVFFNAAGVKDPINPPDDFTVEAAGVNWPKLNPTRQILNLEVWFYLSGNGIKSPRVATARYWSYTRGLSYLDGGGLLDKNNPFNPYLFFNAGSLTDEIQMQIRFALKTDPIANPMALPHKKSKVVLSSAHFFIGA